MGKLAFGVLAMGSVLAIGFFRGANDVKAAENQSGYIVNVEGNNLSIRKQHAEVFFVGTTSLVYEKNNK
ncbi:MAG: hypothetical protein IJ733_12605, partial [Lachnospiraceae bacterium]|nr:hypothetical protein [Lachnospiraceae bacterium]